MNLDENGAEFATSMLKNFIKSKKSGHVRDRMIKYVTRILTDKQHQEVHAIVSGFKMPQRVLRKSTGEWYIPDVTSYKGGQFRLYAVETKETIQAEDTDKRWALFAEYAKQNGAMFYIVFPAGAVLQVKQRLAKLSIEAHLWQASEALSV
ncbi:MAG: hypothetical protein JRH18_14575 [Deltaproteobacteria bacterium]|nr:hypothetical protein [Deltaproteobacteria bacterium]MBW1995596.1 hypothetical protein [Deltaproteobacteria bacterium]MBW2152881.1 hypothetical protein [Deltaproteobacteria bacterium]